MADSSQNSANDYLFVYGTLRRSLSPSKDLRQLLHHEAEYLGSATVGGRLYNIGNYPGLILSENPEDIVTGELYKIKNKRLVLSSLDRYEGCVEPYPKPWEYERIRAEVTTEKGSTLLSWLYIYQWNVTDSIRIQSGDYLDFVLQK